MGERVNPIKVKCRHCRRVYWTTSDSKFCGSDCYDEFRERGARYIPTPSEIAAECLKIRAENGHLVPTREDRMLVRHPPDASVWDDEELDIAE